MPPQSTTGPVLAFTKRIRRAPVARQRGVVGGSIGLLLAVLLTGCSEPTVIPTSAELQQSSKHDDELFRNVVDNLNRLSDYGPDNVLLEQIAGRLNQWSRSSDSAVDWAPDPLIETLPKICQEGLVDQLAADEYAPYDAVFLREAILMRDTTRYVCRDVFDELEMARRLFDWTVDNIALDPNPLPGQELIVQMPWQTLIFGHGRPDERAWVFIQLARQQNLDVVLVEVPHESSDVPWFTALVGQGGELFLFDHTYGLPILTKDGRTVATLAQVAADDSLLRQFDTSEMRYPIEAKDLQQAGVLIEADRHYLSRNMKRIERQLAGLRRVVLTCRPTEVADKLKLSPLAERIRLWVWPYQAPGLLFRQNAPSLRAADRQMIRFQMKLVERQPELEFEWVDGQRVATVDKEKFRENVIYPLWGGRLKHLAGDLGPSRQDAADGQPADDANPLEGEAGQRNAKSLYLQARTMRIDTAGANAEQLEQLKFLNAIASENRESATYWLGLVSMQQQNYELARRFFEWTLELWPAGQWRSGARFNLARALELSGQTDAAIEAYRQVPAPAKLGALVRAKRLDGAKSDPEKGAKAEAAPSK